MREIKFRMWSWIVHNHPDMPDCGRMIYIKEPCTDRTAYKEGRLMQYTGLKDREGIEIWEGDIVQADMGSNYRKAYRYPKFKTEFDDGAFMFGALILHDDNIYNFRLKVIGNIWEHLELLNERE